MFTTTSVQADFHLMSSKLRPRSRKQTRYIQPNTSDPLIVPSFLSFLFCFCFLFSRWSFVDVPLIFSCPADHVPDWQPRILLGMVEAGSVNVKNTRTQQPTHLFFHSLIRSR